MIHRPVSIPHDVHAPLEQCTHSQRERERERTFRARLPSDRHSVKPAVAAAASAVVISPVVYTSVSVIFFVLGKSRECKEQKCK